MSDRSYDTTLFGYPVVTDHSIQIPSGGITFGADILDHENLAAFFAKARTTKSEFGIQDAHGNYVDFLGIPELSAVGADVTDIELLEYGNIYDRQGSD